MSIFTESIKVLLQHATFEDKKSMLQLLNDSLSSIDEVLICIIQTKGKVHAIKHYKDITGNSLGRSLEYINNLIYKLNLKGK